MNRVAGEAPRALRVAHVVYSFRTGGLERVVQALTRAGAATGVRSLVIAYGEDGELREQLEAEGVETRWLETEPGLQPKLCLRLARELRRWRADVVHTHHIGPFIYGAPAAKLARVPHVYTEHSREHYASSRLRLVGRAMRHFAHVVCVSNELAAWRSEHFGDAPTVILNGVPVPPVTSDDERREVRAELGADGAFVVGCVARLAPEKDHQTLLEAFSLLMEQAPHSRLVLVGWGPEREALEARARALGVADAVLFLGVRSDVERLLRAFDVIALSSLREGLPMALLEGMAAGLPVVATDVGEVASLTEGRRGVTVAVGDARGLADALARYGSDDEQRRKDGARGRDRVVAVYSADAMARGYAALYRAVSGRA